MKSQTQSPLVKTKDWRGVWYGFLLGAATALAIFLPFLLVDKGFFLYAGDYNLQQIPFYMHVQNFIQTGGGTWDWATDLGSSVVTSYSFYNMGSPFLWLTALLPNRWMPYMMVPLFIIKFGCISAAANLYFMRYSKSRNMRLIVGLVYAFCGFNVYNIFFNHMLEPVIIFPLMLWALDSFMYEGKRGWFAIFVGLSLLNSYFFFVGNVVFIILYFGVKLLTGDYKITLPKFGFLALEAVIGLGIGMILLLPSIYVLMGNPRTDNVAEGFNLIMYWEVQQYFAILQSAFLPPDPTYLPNLFTRGAIRWTSMSLFLPVVSVAGVFAYFKSRKKNSIKIILIVSFVMMLVPFLNSSFYAFNASYYARWYYMPILIMCFATLRSLEDVDIDLEFGARWACIATALFAVFGLLPQKVDGAWKLGVAQEPLKFWLTMGQAALGIAVFYVLVVYFRKNKKRFGALLLAAVMGFSVLYSVVHMSLTKFPQWDRDSNFRQHMYIDSANLNLPDDQFYRLDGYEVSDNLGLWANKSSLQTFNSVVTPSIMEFYPFVGVSRDVGSRPNHDMYALRGLLSVRFMVMPANKVGEFDGNALASSGWVYYGTQGTLKIYENANFVPLGFTYDNYCNIEELKMLPDVDRGPLLMQAMALTPEQVEKYSHLFGNEAKPFMMGTGFAEYEAAVEQRKESASYETSYDASGFSAKIKLQKDNLVFFSVPYDEGFTATVNGKETEVLQVNSGLMAVEGKEGDNTIVFSYRTRGFSAGIAITVFSMLVLAAYWVLMTRYDKKKALVAVGAPAQNNNDQQELQKELDEKEATRQMISAALDESALDMAEMDFTDYFMQADIPTLEGFEDLPEPENPTAEPAPKDDTK